MNSFIKKFKKFFNSVNEDYVSEYAAECAYFTILSFIPFIIFFLTLVQYTNIDKETIFYIVKEVVPTTIYPIILDVINEMYSKSLGTISISAVIALWSSGKGFFSLCKGLRTIYNINYEKSSLFVRIEGTIYTFVLIFSIILFLLIVVFGNCIYNTFLYKIEGINNIISYILKIRIIFMIGIMFLVFLFLYKFILGNKVNIRNQVYGAVFSSVSWYFLSYFFSMYIYIFNSFTNTYGSLSIIILMMMWIYWCMYIILLGAEINVNIR